MFICGPEDLQYIAPHSRRTATIAIVELDKDNNDVTRASGWIFLQADATCRTHEAEDKKTTLHDRPVSL
jgi:hypothetical protein